jgi:hypothetical protein
MGNLKEKGNADILHKLNLKLSHLRKFFVNKNAIKAQKRVDSLSQIFSQPLNSLTEKNFQKTFGPSHLIFNPNTPMIVFEVTIWIFDYLIPFDFTGVYTQTSYFVDWIEDQLQTVTTPPTTSTTLVTSTTTEETTTTTEEETTQPEYEEY